MISFEVKSVEMPDVDLKKICTWLNEVATLKNKLIGNLNYLFCDDKEILRVNRQFLNHDYYTDIITFDYSYKNKVSGDIFISLNTVRSNAEELKIDYNEELRRVIVHGLLHLLGIDDKGEGQREIMENHEDKALELWHSL